MYLCGNGNDWVAFGTYSRKMKTDIIARVNESLYSQARIIRIFSSLICSLYFHFYPHFLFLPFLLSYSLHDFYFFSLFLPFLWFLFVQVASVFIFLLVVMATFLVQVNPFIP